MTTVAFLPRRIIGKDANVFTAAPIAYADGTIGSAGSLLGYFQSLDFGYERDEVSTKSLTDNGQSYRATGISGDFSAKGFVPVAGGYADVFAAGAHIIVNYIEITDGAQHQFQAFAKSYKKTIGNGPVEDTISGPIEGVPLYAPAGGDLAEITLE